MTLDMTQKSSEKVRAVGDTESEWQQSALALATYRQIYIQIAKQRKLNVLHEYVVRHLASKSRATNTYWGHQLHVSQLALAFINSRKLGIRTCKVCRRKDTPVLIEARSSMKRMSPQARGPGTCSHSLDNC